ncbi:unnamed protein product [Lactuca saligna]|uniref:Uncharacterized protein n=1 Tax=Lactuca saligna TaxID=75948 RepID=A0AA35W189_LACSI|nr:unnamed protein product [Lactuca saligna]
MSSQLSTPPFHWGPWRVEERKQYPLLCRRLASLNEEFISHKSPTGGFDFISRKRIEQKLIDYNQEAERFGVLSIVSHKLIGSVMWHGLKGVNAYLYHESQAACFKKARDDLYMVKAWVFSPQVKVIKSDIREEDVLKEKDAFEDLKKLAAKSLTETVNQLIGTVNQVKEDENAEQATRPSRVTDAVKHRATRPQQMT